MSYLTDLRTVLAAFGLVVLNFSPALLGWALICALIKSVRPACQRASERTYHVSYSGYHTTAAELRQAAQDPPFVFEDLERELEGGCVPSRDYLDQLERSQVRIADWLTNTRINTKGPCYQRISRLRVALRRRHDLVSRAVYGATTTETMLETWAGNVGPDSTPAERAEFWEAV